jgi:hypothetical protein
MLKNSKKQGKQKLDSINDELYQRVASQEGVTQSVVRDIIINGQSKFTAHIMSNNTFHGVRWPYFGVFKAKHKVIQVLNYMKGLDPIQKEFFRLQLQRKYQLAKQLGDFSKYDKNLGFLNSPEDGAV